MVFVTFFGSSVTNCADFVRIFATLDPSQLKSVRKDDSNWYIDLGVDAADLDSAVAVFKSQVPSATILYVNNTENKVHVDCGCTILPLAIAKLEAKSAFLRTFKLAEIRAAHENHFRTQPACIAEVRADLAASEARLSEL